MSSYCKIVIEHDIAIKGMVPVTYRWHKLQDKGLVASAISLLPNKQKVVELIHTVRSC